MTTEVWLDGTPAVPSFRVARGEIKTELDNIGGLYVIMNPYDMAVRLAESGHITQALMALNGFVRREIDIKADAAIKRIDKMYREYYGE